MAHETGFDNLVGHLFDGLALVHVALGDTNRADVTFRRALELALANGDAALEARARSGYGRVALAAGRTSEARGRFHTAVNVAHRHGSYPFAMEALEALIDIDVSDQQLIEGARTFALLRSSPFAAPAVARSAEAELEQLRDQLENEPFAEACKRGAAMQVDEAFEASAQEPEPLHGGRNHALSWNRCDDFETILLHRNRTCAKRAQTHAVSSRPESQPTETAKRHSLRHQATPDDTAQPQLTPSQTQVPDYGSEGHEFGSARAHHSEPRL